VRLLALPQNETHTANLDMLVPALEDHGIAVCVLDLKGIFHQRTQSVLRVKCNSKSLDLSTATPFYRMPPWEQMRVVFAARRPLADALEGMDAVMVFNDGAIQRLALAEARHRQLLTTMLLDGIISEYGERTFSAFPRLILRRVGLLFGGSWLSALLPSEVGMSPVETLFVIGQHSADVLRKRGTRARRIVVSGLPRWSDGVAVRRPMKVRKLLYLTGAFNWHGNRRAASAQIADVQTLRDHCQRLGLELKIRVHPRDDVAPYVGYGTVSSSEMEPLANAIDDSDMVVSMVSTGLLEAVSAGRLARCICINGTWRPLRRSFAADPIFSAVRSERQLGEMLAIYKSGVSPLLYEEQRKRLPHYVRAGGAEAARSVVSTLIAA
jgi:hypothetical protein